MSEPARRPRLALAILILLITTFATFGRVVTFDFTSWDDYETIARNPKLNPPTVAALKDFWTRPQMDLYVPLTWTVWALMANATHDPRAFHLLNLAIHAAMVLAVFALLDRLVRDRLAALLGALVFAVHPVQVESVAWVSGTKDLLCGFFAAVALWQYVSFAQGDRDGLLTPPERVRMMGVATAAFVLAMLSKPTAVVVPLMALAIDLLIVRRRVRNVVKIVAPWLVLAIPAIVWTKLAQPAAHAQESAALWARPLVAADALAFYFWKLIWPARLTFDYGRTPEIAITRGWIYVTWLAPAALAAVIYAYRRTLAPAAGFLFVLPLLPVFGLIPFDFQAYSTVADHYLYLPMLGVALAMAWLIGANRRRGAHVIAGVIIALLTARSFVQTNIWRNTHSLCKAALQVNPSSFAAYNSLAAAAAEAGDPSSADRLSARAIKLRPSFAAAHFTHADAMRELGDFPAAIASYERGLQFENDYVPGLNNLAAMLAARREFDRAIALSRRALAVDPTSIQGHLNLGRIHVLTQQPDLARREFEAVLHLDPQNPTARALLQELPPNPAAP